MLIKAGTSNRWALKQKNKPSFVFQNKSLLVTFKNYGNKKEYSGFIPVITKIQKYFSEFQKIDLVLKSCPADGTQASPYSIDRGGG